MQMAMIGNNIKRDPGEIVFYYQKYLNSHRSRILWDQMEDNDACTWDEVLEIYEDVCIIKYLWFLFITVTMAAIKMPHSDARWGGGRRWWLKNSGSDDYDDDNYDDDCDDCDGDDGGDGNDGGDGGVGDDDDDDGDEGEGGIGVDDDGDVDGDYDWWMIIMGDGGVGDDVDCDSDDDGGVRDDDDSDSEVHYYHNESFSWWKDIRITNPPFPIHSSFTNYDTNEKCQNHDRRKWQRLLMIMSLAHHNQFVFVKSSNPSQYFDNLTLESKK